ncbi:peptidase M23 [Clostridium sp. Sa3CUN1]|uniref:Peptidase M23 n=1 Tax=Clostridium gallinarum TaxID=2762246 RepID=A0ABR8Q2Y3_9CLOT|nr:peptidase M23 [Clostridium gallinarum]MBD7914767.1 peptidase M23 [Clostridium gallinarum]
MVNNYNEAYRDYYERMRKRTSGSTREVDKIVSSREDIYPSMTNVRNNYNYNRGTYGIVKEKKKFKYIDRFILRLIITFTLFLGVFTLKIMPNQKAKEIYETCKTAINSNIDYNEVFSKIGKSGTSYNDILKNIEEKYSEIIEDIKLEDLNKAFNL